MASVLLNLQTQPWHQIQDSPGAHNAATLNLGDPLWCLWKPEVRTGGGKWDNLYCWQPLVNGDDHIVLDHSVTFRSQQDLVNTNNWEFEAHQNVSGKVYNGGWQANFDQGFWYTYHFGAPGHWVATTIPVKSDDFVPTKPTRIVAEYQRIAAGMKFLTLTVNGTCNQVDYIDPAFAKSVPDALNVAWQLDSRGQGAPIVVALNSYNVFTL